MPRFPHVGDTDDTEKSCSSNCKASLLTYTENVGKCLALRECCVCWLLLSFVVLTARNKCRDRIHTQDSLDPSSSSPCMGSAAWWERGNVRRWMPEFLATSISVSTRTAHCYHRLHDQTAFTGRSRNGSTRPCRGLLQAAGHNSPLLGPSGTRDTHTQPHNGALNLNTGKFQRIFKTRQD